MPKEVTVPGKDLMELARAARGCDLYWETCWWCHTHFPSGPAVRGTKANRPEGCKVGKARDRILQACKDA